MGISTVGLYKDLYCTSIWTLKISLWWAVVIAIFPCGKGENMLEKCYLLEKHPNVLPELLIPVGQFSSTVDFVPIDREQPALLYKTS